MQRKFILAVLSLLVCASLASAQSRPVQVTCIAPSGTPPTSYNFYRSLTLGQNYTLIGNSPTCSYTDNTANQSTTYYYVAASVDSLGNVGAFSIPSIATTNLNLNTTSACSGLNMPTVGCNGVGIMPIKDNAANAGLQTSVIDPLPTTVSTLDLHTLLYSGATTRTMVEYQPWFCNTSSPSPCNGHKNIGMQGTNPVQILWQAQYMKSIGADVTDIDYYGCSTSCSTPQNSNQSYPLSVTTALANAIAANPATTPKFEIMIDGGSVNSSSTSGTQLATNGSMTLGSAVLTSASNPFTAAQVGTPLAISNAGAAGGTLYTWIVSFTNSGSVTVGDAAATTTTAGTVTLTGQCPAQGGDRSGCLIGAINLQMDYLARNWLFQSYYEKNANNSHPIVLFFFGYGGWPGTNFNTVFSAVKLHATSGQSCGTSCTYTQTIDLVDENAGAFAETGIDGGYAWPQPLSYSSTNQFQSAGSGGTYLSNFYSTARANPSQISIGLIYKGFDDNNAGWGTNRVTAQQCGQVLNLSANAITTAGYNAGTQLQYVQFATWNDYEEATEIETGVDNCISVNQPTISGGNINWTLSKSDATYATTSTISSISIYTGTTAPTTLYASGISPTTTSYVAPAASAGLNVWVYMVGKPLIQNRLSASVPVSTCVMPNPCAYDGVEVIQWGSIPNFNDPTLNGIQNNAVGYDTSFLTHKTFNGTTFTSGTCPGPSCTLSQITRLTDAASAPGRTCNFSAGIGGSGEFTVVNTNSTLVGVVCNGAEHIGLFNPSGPNIGHFTPVNAGVLITRDLCQAGGLCSPGTSGTTNDFGAISFSQTDPSIVFTFGSDQYDITGAAYDGMNVCPYQINYAASTPIVGAPIGAYQLLPCVVDFKFGLPQYNAQQWGNAQNYSFGNYVIHNLTSAEMATGGVWTTATIYALGDIVVGQGGSTACMYRVTIASGVSTSGTSPAFVNTAPCKNDTLTDAAGNTWRGTNSTAAFLYQNTNTACTNAAPCGSGASFTIGAGNHPDLVSTVTEGAGATKNIWTNVGPAYVPANPSQLWFDDAGTSKDCAYVVNGICFPSKYGTAISTNTYGDNLPGGGYGKYAGGQGTGVDLELYDATANAFQHLNTLTGIWNTYTCGAGTNGANCGSIVTTTVGTTPLTAISNPLGTGQACPFFIHNMKDNTLGTFTRITDQINVYSACDTGVSVKNHGRIWNMQPGAFNAGTTAPSGSLQIMFGGIAHDAVDTTEFISARGGEAVPGGFNGGWFTEVYPISSAANQPAVSVYMAPGVNPIGGGIYPTGCNTNATNPDCNLSNFMDQHISCVGGCEDRAKHACGTTYNYATFSPIAFNAWQNMETCYSTGTLYQVGALPATSAGPVAQFTHTFATGTHLQFNTQFQISEWSQDGNWLFFGTDYACQLGSTTGAAPNVWTSGTHVGFLAIGYSATPPLPSTLTSLCGVPWIPASTYKVGNTIDPIENTNSAGGVDHIFQAIASCVAGVCASTSGTGTGVSGPANQPGGGNNQPVCVVAGVNKSCFASTLAPTISAAGDTVCDNSSFNGAGVPVTGTQLNTLNPSAPYTASCPNGIVWQDLGPQTSRGDVFAVQLASYGSIAAGPGPGNSVAPATVIFAGEYLYDIPFSGGSL